MTILHGDDQVKVHEELTKLLATKKQQGTTVLRVNAKELDIQKLENLCGTADLFSSKKCVVIDGVFSLPKSAKKEELLEWIGTQEQSHSEIICVEQKAVTALQLKKFPKALLICHKIPMLVFSFVEHIGIAKTAELIVQLHEILQTQDSEFVFAMIVRHIRTLIAFVSDGTYDGPPFGRQKIERLARSWTLDRLFLFHKKLTDIDDRLKHSRNVMTLSQEIDLLLVQ